LSLSSVLLHFKSATQISPSIWYKPRQGNMTEGWNPREVLGIVDIHHCMGHYTFESGRCHTQIEESRIQQINIVIEEMAQLPLSPGLAVHLSKLAQNCLCMDHQCQRLELLRDWLSSLLQAHHNAMVSQIQR
jgi:hypothetical protein